MDSCELDGLATGRRRRTRGRLAATAGALAAVALAGCAPAASSHSDGSGASHTASHGASQGASRGATPTTTSTTAAAATTVTTAATISGPLGPRGYGALRLGMSLTDALATGQVDVSPSDGYQLAGGGSLCFQPGAVLTAILAPAGATTPEGVGDGSPAARVRAAYHLPGGVHDSGWRVPAGPGATYHFDLVPGSGMQDLSLEGPRQECWN